MPERPIDKLKKTLSKEEIVLLEQAMLHEREKLAHRFPLVMTLAGVFGVVATLLGIEKIIDKSFLTDDPWLLVFIGVITLILSGLFYKKL